MRERLLEVALELFSRHGYEGTTVSSIVAAAGVTQPMLYYYFRNKQALFEALVEQALVGYDRILQHDLPAGLSSRDQLLELCRQGLRASRQNPVLTRLLFSLAFAHSDEVGIRVRVDAVIRRFLTTLEGIIRRGIAAGELREADPEDLAWAVYAVLFRAMETALVGVSTGPAERRHPGAAGPLPTSYGSGPAKQRHPGAAGPLPTSYGSDPGSEGMIRILGGILLLPPEVSSRPEKRRDGRAGKRKSV
ncbi:MAG TPA: TetR/AcrR family transcriptional regulator [Candidatus Ozemobacteraceae bacterium]|nr:TetR/AcrR family transcriptional regulator [Candidatus Ozemobacteraceae bacterium]